MTSRADDVSMRYARPLKAADKRTKGRILDEVVSVTGWSWDNARRRLMSAAQGPPVAGHPVAACMITAAMACFPPRTARPSKAPRRPDRRRGARRWRIRRSAASPCPASGPAGACPH